MNTGSKINSNGSWVALIECRIIALREFLYLQRVDYSDIVYESSSVHDSCLFLINSEGNHTILSESFFVYPLYLSKVVAVTEGDSTSETDSQTNYPLVKQTTNAGYCFTTHSYDSRFLPNAPNYSDYAWENEQPVETYIKTIVDDFSFPIQGDFQAKLLNINKEPTEWQFGGVFKDGEQIIGEILPDETDAHKWNMSLTEIKGEQFLFGIRSDAEREVDGALYKINEDGTVKQVGVGLKNFRLCELSNMTKAKK